MNLETILLTLRRKDLFTKSLVEKEEKVKQPVKGVDYDRYGSYIPDPDVSHYDYKKLREKDRTLPVNDPRTTGDQAYYGFSLDPLQKWLYFSDYLGSYERRKRILTDDRYSTERMIIWRKYSPSTLTKRQSFESDKYFNIYELERQLPNNLVDLLLHKEKWGILIRYLLGRFLYMIDRRDSGEPDDPGK
jgi:hypothetical protein